MYLNHFRLREYPFSLTPDTQFFFDNPSHREVFNTLLLALRHSEGFISAYIPNPYLTPDELKGFVAQEIGVSFSADTPAYQLLNDIYQRLLELAAAKRQVVLVVDEAQAMPRETLEALRLLTNLETEKTKLLQVVLIGQPELDELLNRADLRQLKQRIVFSEYLQGITRERLPAYVQFRLMSAGYAGPALFSPSALRLLHRASGGVPRLINPIAHKALLAAYGEGSARVQRRHLVRAIADTDESRAGGRWLARRDYWLWPLLGGGAALVVSGVPRLLGVWP